MNLQVIASPAGDILWVSGALPGSVHDKNAEWIWGVLAELEAAGLVTLADKGYQGSTYAKIPYRARTSRNPRNRPIALTRSSARPASGRMPQLKTCSRPGKFSGSCAAAHGAPVSSPKPSTFCRPARHKQDGKVQCNAP
jgi:DDE superfamily endonuclease